MSNVAATVLAVVLGSMVVVAVAYCLARAQFGKNGSRDVEGSHVDKSNCQPIKPSSANERGASSGWDYLLRFGHQGKDIEKGSGKDTTDSDFEERDLQDKESHMALPPIPAYTLNRKVSELGTQVR